MRNDYSSYFLYFGFNKLASITIRAKVTLVNKVEPKLLTIATNNYAKRRSWLTKTPIYQNHEYKFIDNDLPIVVAPFVKRSIKLNAKESNYHLFQVQYVDNIIYFNISHAIIGGIAFNKLIFAILNEYIDLIENKTSSNYDVDPSENLTPKLEDFLNIEPIIKPIKPKKFFVPNKDNLSSLIFKNGVCAFYEFNVKDLLPFAKSVDASPSVLFAALFYLVLTKLFPKNKKIIHGVIPHNPLLSFPKYKNYHSHFVTHLYQNLSPKLKTKSLEELCTMIRGNVILQSDPSIDANIIKNTLLMCDKIDQEKNYFKKCLYITLNHPMMGLKNSRFTYSVSYNGQNNDQRLGKYIKNYFYMVDGVLLNEIVSLNDKLFLTLPINKNGHKYTKAFEKIMQEYGIIYHRLPNEERLLPKVCQCRTIK